MDSKIIAISAVVVLLVAGAGAYLVLNNGSDKDSIDSEKTSIAVNGIIATESTVADGQYNVFKRNLVLCTNGEPTGNVKCFLDWINSSEGQKIVGEEFVKIDESSYVSAPAAPDKNGKCKILVGGSTSIQDTMTKLADAYHQKYDYMVIEVQGGGSGVGASNTINGTFDIGMCSRDLKTSETDKGLIPQIIGVDGVAVIVNNAGVKNLTTEQIAKIYSGEITNWKDVGGYDKEIAVLAREDGSGTRECFENGLKTVDKDWSMKVGVNKLGSTGGIINSVNNTDGSIGYISVGMLNSL